MTSPIVAPTASASITLDTPVIIEPGGTVSSNGFEESLGAWGAGWAHDAAARTGTGYIFTGSSGTPDDTGVFYGWMPFEPLPAREYTATIWAARYYDAPVDNARIRVVGLTTDEPLTAHGATIAESAHLTLGDVYPWDNSGYKVIEFTFTTPADLTAYDRYQVRIEYDGGAGDAADVVWDDWQLDLTTVYGTGADFTISEGTISLDDSWSPYCQAGLDVPLTNAALVEQIDPKQKLRVEAVLNDTQALVTTTAWSVDFELFGYQPFSTFLGGITTWALADEPFAHSGDTVLTTGTDAVGWGVAYNSFASYGPDAKASAWVRLVEGSLALAGVILYDATGGVDTYHSILIDPRNGDTGATGMGFQIRDRTLTTGAVGVIPDELIQIESWYRVEAWITTEGTVEGRLYNFEGIEIAAATRVVPTPFASVHPGVVGYGRAWYDDYQIEVTEPAPPRVFDLALRTRKVDHKRGTIRLELASDEALLQDHAPLVTDRTPRTYEASLRAIVDYVLGVVIPGAQLEPGTADVDLTSYWPATNWLTNPSVVGNADGYTPGTNCSSVTYDTGDGAEGTSSSVRWASAGAGWTNLHARFWAVESGGTYCQAVYIRSGSGRDTRLLARYRDADGVIIRDDYGPIVPTANNEFHLLSHLSTAPPGAASLSFNVLFLATTSGQNALADLFLLTESDEHVVPFTGSTGAPGYVTSWDEAANNSQSQRTPILERLPDMHVWPAGTSAWDFLQPLLTASGLRLFCDELRRWYLVDDETFTQPGEVALTQGIAVEGEDTVSRDEDLWADGVVVTYTWTERGESREVRDVAGTSGRVRMIDYDRPFPGKGAAAYVLSKMRGLGRTQRIQAFATFAERPGMDLSTQLPGAHRQEGRLTSVEWDVRTGLASFGSSKLTTVLPEA